MRRRHRLHQDFHRPDRNREQSQQVSEQRRLGIVDGGRYRDESARSRFAFRGQQHRRHCQSDQRSAELPWRDDGGQLIVDLAGRQSVCRARRMFRFCERLLNDA
jgi:hypothetical protein